MKMCLKYLIYIMLLSLMVFGGRYALILYQNNMQNLAWGLSGVYIFNILMLVIFGAIGAALGFENLLIEAKKEGRWKINFYKIVIIGVPSLYFSLTYSIHYCSIGFIRNLLSYPATYLLTPNTNIFIGIFQVILGYSIISSFHKSNLN